MNKEECAKAEEVIQALLSVELLCDCGAVLRVIPDVGVNCECGIMWVPSGSGRLRGYD